MRKLILGAALALLLPTTAIAANEPSPEELAKAACNTEKHEMGTKLLKKTYARKSTSKAMKACVAKAEEEAKNAAKACKALKKRDPDEFEAMYGSRENAFDKCVSQTAREDT